MTDIRIAISDNDIVDVSSIEFDVGTRQYFVRTLEQLGTSIYPGPTVYVVGKGSTLEIAMTVVAHAHKARREELKAR